MIGQTSNNKCTSNFGKPIISYTLSHGITTMKKHIANEHVVALIQYIEHTKVLDGTIIGQPKKNKSKVVPPLAIIKLFSNQNPYETLMAFISFNSLSTWY
jgi:hypothetical protein